MNLNLINDVIARNVTFEEDIPFKTRKIFPNTKNEEEVKVDDDFLARVQYY